MTVPSDTIVTITFPCPRCGRECKWVGEMYAIREVDCDAVTLEAECSECSGHLVIQVSPIDPDQI